MARSFRFLFPHMNDVPVLGRFFLIEADILYRKDNIHSPEKGRITVQFPIEFMHLAGDAHKAKRLLSYYAIENLKVSFSSPDPKLEYQFEPSEAEYKELLTIDSSVIARTWNLITMNQYIEIDERLQSQTRKVFISCGQFHPNEKQLGKQIKQMIDNVEGFEGYFAENQQSLDGLSKNIFNALHNSVAIVAVMHRRDMFSHDHYRGSVWIEQEIAIAAFMTQTLTMPIKVKAYIQKGVNLEGVRSLIQLNPLIFETDEEVIDDVKKSLPQILASIEPLEDNWVIS